uniref:Uncharacterized protein n=1 Tax=Podoviridae sp. ctz6O13 TaxID=2827757 RepID=A0A8S5TKI5_9CAUD|nr:MAG TPA: hypothetical protein [Podoviridae sp. ctz6O13]
MLEGQYGDGRCGGGLRTLLTMFARSVRWFLEQHIHMCAYMCARICTCTHIGDYYNLLHAHMCTRTNRRLYYSLCVPAYVHARVCSGYACHVAPLTQHIPEKAIYLRSKTLFPVW